MDETSLSNNESTPQEPIPEKRYFVPEPPPPPQRPVPNKDGAAFGNGCVSPILLLVATTILGILLTNLLGDSMDVIYGVIVATAQILLLIGGLIAFAAGKHTNNGPLWNFGKGVLVAYGLILLLGLLMYGTCGLS